MSLLGLGHISQDNITVQVQHGSVSSCIRVLSGDGDMVTHLKNDSIGQSTCPDTISVSHMWSAHTAKHLPHTWCSRPGQTMFEMNIGHMPGLETYLTQDQRDNMYTHLMVTSLVLFLVCVAMLTWAWVHVSRDQTRDMTLLPGDSDQEDM